MNKVYWLPTYHVDWLLKIFGGSNAGVEGSCLTPPATSQATVDRYCGGTLNCVVNANSPSTIVS